MSNGRERTIHYIPEKSHVVLSEEVIYYLLMQVPEGRLTRRQDMEEYLAACFGVHHVRIDHTAYLARGAFDPDYIYGILDHVPMHREVSAQGYLSDPIIQSEKLQKEGFEILQPARAGYSPRVKNHKKYLFDFKMELQINRSILLDIHRNGLRDYF